MKTIENSTLEIPYDLTAYAPEMSISNLDLCQESLAHYEYELLNNQGDHPWWPFFDGGMCDSKGVLWSVYNRWCDEEEPDGWKVVRCGDDESEFREITINNVIRSAITKPGIESPGLITFQLHLYDESAKLTDNDVLNVLLYHDASGISDAKLQMWNQDFSMRPIEWPNY